MDFAAYAVFVLAFGLGMLHAFDPDHLAAVSGLTGARAGESGWRNGLRISGHWALGHGVTLLLLAMPVLFLGFVLPSAFGSYVEMAIGAVLMALGFTVLWRALHPHLHHHGRLLPHVHWHAHAIAPSHRRATAVGMLHGAAGSAGVYALLPAALHDNPWWGVAYLVAFAAGVCVAMLLFAGMFSRIVERAAAAGAHVLRTLQLSLAAGTIGYGAYWLYAAR